MSSNTPAPARMPTHIPRFDLQRGKNSSSIAIGKWTIRTAKHPILNIKEVDAAEKSLNLPLPEMTFGNNSLTLSYTPGSGPSSRGGGGERGESSRNPHSTDVLLDEPHQDLDDVGVTLSFSALDALAQVPTGEGWEERVGGGVRVAMAETWGKSSLHDHRSTPSALLTDIPLPSKPVKPHDWTYSTTHAGAVAGPSQPFSPSSTHELPLKLLARQDPVLDSILFYDDVPLFEDELHDNGESIYNARIRVMPHSFFILTRLFLRVDNVIFRIFDTRIYHQFGTQEVVREVSGMEAEYSDVKAMLEKPTDLSPLTDPNFVYKAMTHITGRQHDGLQNGQKDKGGKPWPGLGKRVDVLRLPGEVDEVASRVDQVRLS